MEIIWNDSIKPKGYHVPQQCQHSYIYIAYHPHTYTRGQKGSKSEPAAKIATRGLGMASLGQDITKGESREHIHIRASMLYIYA